MAKNTEYCRKLCRILKVGFSLSFFKLYEIWLDPKIKRRTWIENNKLTLTTLSYILLNSLGSLFNFAIDSISSFNVISLFRLYLEKLAYLLLPYSSFDRTNEGLSPYLFHILHVFILLLWFNLFSWLDFIFVSWDHLDPVILAILPLNHSMCYNLFLKLTLIYSFDYSFPNPTWLLQPCLRLI